VKTTVRCSPASLADGLVHFVYNVAMPGLLVVTIAQESARNLLEWRFLLAFGGGSVLCFALVFLAVHIGWGRDLRSSAIYGMTAAMTNTGFVALPILHAIYGQPPFCLLPLPPFWWQQ
jgi:malonate transporter